MIENFRGLKEGQFIWYSFVSFDRDGLPLVKTKPTKLRITKIEQDLCYGLGYLVARTEIIFKNGNTKEFFSIYEGQQEVLKDRPDLRGIWRSSSMNFWLTEEEAREYWNSLLQSERDFRRSCFECFNKEIDKLLIA